MKLLFYKENYAGRKLTTRRCVLCVLSSSTVPQSSMLPLAATMASAGLISNELAAVFAVPKISKGQRPPSAASIARSVTSDEFFSELRKAEEKKKEIALQKQKNILARAEKKGRQEEEKAQKTERVQQETTVNCSVCGVRNAEITCIECEFSFHEECQAEVCQAFGETNPLPFCVNCRG